MRGRSLAATLAFAFGVTTLAVFVLVGSFLYLALAKQIKAQDDLDIVLAARHARRLAQELVTSKGIREHGDRLTSTVLGNEAMSLEVFGPDGRMAIEHNAGETFAAPAGAASSAAPAASNAPYASAVLNAASETSEAGDVSDLQDPGEADQAGGVGTIAALPPLTRIAASARITEADIGAWTGRNGAPIRGILADARLHDGETATVLIARNMSDRWRLLDRYRDKLTIAGAAGVILAMLLSYLLIRAAMRPLRDIAASAGLVTVNRLNTRITVARVPSELEALVNALNAMLERVDHGFQHLSRFTADLAHDMRTPLSNMRGAAEVALARPRSVDEYESVLASNLEECDRLSRMIESVLFLARAEHPQFVKHMREFDAGQELTRIAEYFEGIADDANVRVQVTGAARLTADLELFRRAVSNLLANAIRYTPHGGEIALDVRPSADAVRVTVSNQGQPIAAEHLERIFDRFYRIDPSRSALPSSGSSQGSTGSTGLGLAIVRTIMELHGGTVHAESDAQSTCFVLTFRRV
ncbi:Adaptive-response sensory-kinase SasA [Paraburkholderia domus]|jgi:heavy metal sensor kinase|uniref:Sensor protein n=1 Tax=Paraburkholderia domus TaxID=2793075 RepID=A0A9N8MMX3_9BURK|nr:heavy metal sensor histidine kinase [Paraburkholderia domus]MBK5048417.1 heavy metal sensor histidine kinase [Burkholderia sp. R-70006]MBK5060647.1 heavy metal sensor histidine kinase [Burkholderia sp. R-70199]MBK5085671.1 heavy metal sensor histidine kinase [Burkholderia sp. R-69927]MBK5121847.1 heavy metal sensor histidine kinase [Burkholderia sp. R-69980]MBK5164561.1 heavy metal sensor histidine kinase [Burkholderia sp. R-70211]MBK5182000.1 heavy metal sensor histidine kinase [Burkholde